MNIQYINKPTQEQEYDPTKWNSQDANEVKAAVNSKADKEELLLKADITDLAAKANTSALTTKADKVGGLVPLDQLPPVYFAGATGTGTISDPYTFGSGLSPLQLTTYFQSLPNWAPDKILQGDFSWIAPPQGGSTLEQLATPTISFTGVTGDAIIINWNTVTFGTNYSLQRSTSNTFASVVNVYSGAGTTATDIGLTPLTTYYYRIRATATGFQASNYGLATQATDAQGNTTPVAPTLTANDTANTLSAAHSLGTSEILVSVDNASYSQYTGQIQVGNVARPVGYYKFKIKSATGRNESPVIESPAFTITKTTPVAPTNVTVDNTNDLIEWTYSVVSNNPSDYEISINNGTYVTMDANPYYVGDVAIAVGQAKIRSKENAFYLVSPTVANTVAFTSAPEVTNPIEIWTNTAYVTISGNTLSFASPAGNYGYAQSNKKFPEGVSGYVMQEHPVNGSSAIVVDRDFATGEGTGGMDMVIWSNTNSNQLVGRESTNYFGAGSRPQSVDTKTRIRVDATTMYGEYSLDGGASWSLMTSKARPSGDLFIRCFADIGETRKCWNVREKGAVTI